MGQEFVRPSRPRAHLASSAELKPGAPSAEPGTGSCALDRQRCLADGAKLLMENPFRTFPRRIMQRPGRSLCRSPSVSLPEPQSSVVEPRVLLRLGSAATGPAFLQHGAAQFGGENGPQKLSSQTRESRDWILRPFIYAVFDSNMRLLGKRIHDLNQNQIYLATVIALKWLFCL